MARRSLQDILSARFHLAPLAGVTNLPFRLFMRELGAGLVVSELISAEGFSHGSHKTRRMMSVHDEERPVGLQIFGARPQAMADAAKCCEDAGADFVDINMGCPVPKVVGGGGGAALLRESGRIAPILEAVRSAIRIPLSVKIRLGWEPGKLVAAEVADIAAKSGADWITIHGRTACEGYRRPADWDAIASLAKSCRIPVVGNGDISNAATAVEKLKSGCCNAVMIGRAALGNPCIFLQCNGLLNGETPDIPAPERMLGRLRDLLVEHADRREAAVRLKKLAVWYSSGMKGKAAFRERIFALVNDPDEIFEVAAGFLTEERFRTKAGGLPAETP